MKYLIFILGLFFAINTNAQHNKKMSIIGQTIEYKYDDGDTYKVSFQQDNDTFFAHWYVLSGKHKGENRKETADIAEVAPNVWFVSWLEPTLEVVSIVFNLNNNKVTCSYYFDKEKYFWHGKIINVKQ